MPRTAAAQTAGAGPWVTNRAANGLHQAGTSLEEFFALQPGDVLAPEMAKVMHNLEGRARQDNMNKLAGRKGTPWKASKLTSSEKAYVWAKSRGKCSHRFCKDPWIKLHYKKGMPNRLTIGESPLCMAYGNLDSSVYHLDHLKM